MSSSGRLNDGTPWVAIDADDPRTKEWIVHTECEACGKVHYFDFWAMFRGEEITCEHCGHKSVAKVRRLVDGEWVEV